LIAFNKSCKLIAHGIFLYDGAVRRSKALSKQSINLQDVFLNQVRKEKLAVTVYMTNGFQLKGVVKGFDNFTVVLDSDGKQQLIYKHAISTVSPVKPVNMIFSDNANQNKGTPL